MKHTWQKIDTGLLTCSTGNQTWSMLVAVDTLTNIPFCKDLARVRTRAVGFAGLPPLCMYMRKVGCTTNLMLGTRISTRSCRRAGCTVAFLISSNCPSSPRTCCVLVPCSASLQTSQTSFQEPSASWISVPCIITPMAILRDNGGRVPVLTASPQQRM